MSLGLIQGKKGYYNLFKYEGVFYLSDVITLAEMPSSRTNKLQALESDELAEAVVEAVNEIENIEDMIVHTTVNEGGVFTHGTPAKVEVKPEFISDSEVVLHVKKE